MIIVQMSGGLGNQMFQYALYRRLKADGKDVKMDDITCYLEKENRTKQLSTFGMKFERATKKEIIQMTDSSMNPLIRIRRKLCGRKNLTYREKTLNFDNTILQMEHVYLEGCFQTEKYFDDIKEILRKEFTFKEEYITGKCKTYLAKINGTEAVSIHIRRGDYLSDIHAPLYGNICTEDYYKKAVEYIKKQIPNAVFYVFTNDIDWAKENMQEKDMCVVDCANEETGYLDMYLMSRCKHNIIANSSFSWWSAWLNQNDSKIVIAPSKWINERVCEDIYNEEMLIL